MRVLSRSMKPQKRNRQASSCCMRMDPDYRGSQIVIDVRYLRFVPGLQRMTTFNGIYSTLRISRPFERSFGRSLLCLRCQAHVAFCLLCETRCSDWVEPALIANVAYTSSSRLYRLDTRARLASSSTRDTYEQAALGAIACVGFATKLRWRKPKSYHAAYLIQLPQKPS